MKVLVICEESQRVTSKFIENGFDAYSCDLKDSSGSYPERHIKGDCMNVLNSINFDYDLVIAHPPCTYLAVCGNRWFKDNPEREQQRKDAISFFMGIVNALERLKVPYAIENPIGVMSTIYKKPSQIIQPWQFGESFSKKTCLWLGNGLPLLKPTNIVDPGEMVIFESGKKMPKWYADLWKLPPEERATMRSKTFTGIAAAMAEQWGKYLKEK